MTYLRVKTSSLDNHMLLQDLRDLNMSIMASRPLTWNETLDRIDIHGSQCPK